MVYIRAKKVKSDNYLYLVKSVWDSKKNTSKQEIIKYLGRATDVEKSDLPIDYRNDPKILLGLAKFNTKNLISKETTLKKFQKQLFNAF